MPLQQPSAMSRGPPIVAGFHPEIRDRAATRGGESSLLSDS